jgi:hypothetical protein
VDQATNKAEALPAAKPTRRDRGVSFIELLIAVVLLGTTIVAVLTAVRATVIGTRIERDHSKAHQWLQSAVGVIEAYQFATCDDTNPADGTVVQAAYQSAVDASATIPYGFTGGTITVLAPKVWDGAQRKFVPFSVQPLCYDQFRMQQQLIDIEVRGPKGDIIEDVEVVKRDTSTPSP